MEYCNCMSPDVIEGEKSSPYCNRCNKWFNRAYWETEHRAAIDAVKRAIKTPGRNDPCPCGSGKKYKKCCL